MSRASGFRLEFISMQIGGRNEIFRGSHKYLKCLDHDFRKLRKENSRCLYLELADVAIQNRGFLLENSGNSRITIRGTGMPLLNIGNQKMVSEDLTQVPGDTKSASVSKISYHNKVAEVFDVELLKISKSFGAFRAVEDVSLSVKRGEFLTFLGPSGCGKTTILKIIAGLEQPSSGTVCIRGEVVTDQPPYTRNISLMFQNYALFPHKTVVDNVAFGLKYRGVNKSDRKKRVEEILDLVHLPGIANRYPHQLSGGQQQRVALARALVVNPAVVLLDEPLSNLDQKLREGMRIELKQIQEEAGITFVFVTHDQNEALTLSDRIAVINQGKIVQIGSPREIYEKPSVKFVAEFIGKSNFMEGRVTEISRDIAMFVTDRGLKLNVSVRGENFRMERMTAQIRSERIKIIPNQITSAPNCFAGRVQRVVYEGDKAEYHVRLDTTGESVLVCEQCAATSQIAIGTQIWLTFSLNDCILLPA